MKDDDDDDDDEEKEEKKDQKKQQKRKNICINSMYGWTMCVHAVDCQREKQNEKEAVAERSSLAGTHTHTFPNAEINGWGLQKHCVSEKKGKGNSAAATAPAPARSK